MSLRTSFGRMTGVYVLVVLLVLGGAGVYFANVAPAARAEVNHGQLVPDEARRGLPVTLGGSVLAHAQVGNRVFVGGDFTQVRLPDGTVLDQAYIYAYDINSCLLYTSDAADE